MNYLLFLFQPTDRDHLLSFLKKKFKADVQSVNVENYCDETMMRVTWKDLLDPVVLAQEITELLPDVIIETPSVTGIESSSRFFNGTQLW